MNYCTITLKYINSLRNIELDIKLKNDHVVKYLIKKDSAVIYDEESKD